MTVNKKKPLKSSKPQHTAEADGTDYEDYDDEVIAPEEIDETFMKNLAPKAYEFAKKAHEGQLRDEGTPYFEHVERVANQVKKSSDTHAYITALLHDVIEDSTYTFEDLSKLFTEDVAKDVLILTKKEGESFETYLKKITLKYVPLLVKLVDRLDNIKSLSQCGSEDKKKKYLLETQTQFIPVVKEARYSKLPEFATLIEQIESACKAVK